MNVIKPEIGNDYLSLLFAPNLDEIYISQMFSYYHRCYVKHLWAQTFVQNSPRIPDALRNYECIGLCNRSFGTIVPKARTLEGGAIRGALQHTGLLVATGGERFRGCVVFPETDNTGKIISAVGYRYAERIRHWQTVEIHWNKPNANGYIHHGMELAHEVIHGKAKH